MNKAKKVRNYKHKYGKAIKSCPIVEYKDLLIQDKNNRLKKIDPLQVVYNGSSFGLIFDMYGDVSDKYSAYKKATGHSISTLIATLKQKGYNTPNVDLNALIEDISHLVIIEPNKQYDILHLNANGYVVGNSALISNDIVIEHTDKPDDFDKGYYKYVNGKWELDEELYQQMWGSL